MSEGRGPQQPFYLQLANPQYFNPALLNNREFDHKNEQENHAPEYRFDDARFTLVQLQMLKSFEASSPVFSMIGIVWGISKGRLGINFWGWAPPVLSVMATLAPIPWFFWRSSKMPSAYTHESISPKLSMLISDKQANRYDVFALTGAASWLLLSPLFSLRGRRIRTALNGSIFGCTLGLIIGSFEKKFYPERWNEGDSWILSNPFWDSLFARFPSLSSSSSSSNNRQQ